jgi:hypothetical protein
MMNDRFLGMDIMTQSYPGTLMGVEDEAYAFMQTIIIILSHAWTVPVIFGIPGNILSVLIANTKRNRNLSPCVYITAMAVVDTALLILAAWFYAFFGSELGKKIFQPRGLIFQ